MICSSVFMMSAANAKFKLVFAVADLIGTMAAKL
jgi:hypothetical protein